VGIAHTDEVKMKKSLSQKNKDLVLQMRTQKEIKLKSEKEIDNLDNKEKIKLQIEILKGYVFRYKNDLKNSIILSKVKMYEEQINKLEKELVELK